MAVLIQSSSIDFFSVIPILQIFTQGLAAAAVAVRAMLRPPAARRPPPILSRTLSQIDFCNTISAPSLSYSRQPHLSLHLFSSNGNPKLNLKSLAITVSLLYPLPLLFLAGSSSVSLSLSLPADDSRPVTVRSSPFLQAVHQCRTVILS